MLSDVLDQQLALAVLGRSVASERVASAYLFSGPLGVGKKTAALAMVRALLCERREGAKACGSCSPCKTTSSFVQLHPSVLLFEDVHEPVAFSRGAIMRLSGYPPLEQEEYLDGMARLVQLGLMQFSPSPGEGENQVDVIVRNPQAVFDKADTKAVSNAAIDKSIELVQNQVLGARDVRPFRLAETLFRKTTAGLYQGTVKVWQVRNVLQQRLSTRSLWDCRHTCVIDDAHKMQEPAQNCLLKTLEEPPLGAVIILITDNPLALLPTVLSRCYVINFGRLKKETIEQFLANWRGAKPKDAALISSFAGGSLGKAIALQAEDLMQRWATAGQLIDCLVNRQIEPVFGAVEQVVAGSERASSAKRQWAAEMLDMLLLYVRDAIAHREGQPSRLSITKEDYRRVNALADCFQLAQLQGLADLVQQARGKVLGNADIRLTLESMLLQRSFEVVGCRL